MLLFRFDRAIAAYVGAPKPSDSCYAPGSNINIKIYVWFLWVRRNQKFGSYLGNVWTTLLYCKWLNVNLDVFKLSSQLGMDDGDAIEVFQQQTGGLWLLWLVTDWRVYSSLRRLSPDHSHRYTILFTSFSGFHPEPLPHVHPHSL